MDGDTRGDEMMRQAPFLISSLLVKYRLFSPLDASSTHSFMMR